MIFTSYEGLCEICQSDLTEREIEAKMCLKKNRSLCSHKTDIYISEFVEFFKKAVGEPRSIQVFWARRIFDNESFAAVAPTGIGKTSFGILMSLFLAKKGKKSYLIFPTTLLVRQAVDKILEYSEKVGMNVSFNEKNENLSIAYYHGNLPKQEKEEFFKLLDSNDYDLLLTTTAFLSKNFEIIRTTFDFIFVDDVDAVLKSSRNVDRILHLLGFSKTREGWKGAAKGVLMVSTATAKKGEKVRLFRELLNFDVGTTTHVVRNIEDIAVDDTGIETLKNILRMMGRGGIIYAESFEESERIFESLKDEFKIGIVGSKSKKDYELFEKGELDYLVGTSYYYGTLVRGLDLPELIRFVVFVKAPVFRVRIEDFENISPRMLRIIALLFRDDERVRKILPYLNNLSTFQLNNLKSILKELIEKGEAAAEDVVLKKGEIVFPDIRTYIQGSGRASRLFAGGITKGASFLLEDDRDVLRSFVKRARYYDIEFKSINEIDTAKLLKEIEDTRMRFRERYALKDLIKPTLFIVESPTKARQIARFFGQPSLKVFGDGDSVLIAYEVPTPEKILLVTATLGHITDLITNRAFHGVEVYDHTFRPIYASIKRCKNCSYQFTEETERCPKCGSDSIDDSKLRIQFLRKIARQTGSVIIGTDPDAEGEKIAWDLANLLRGCGEVKRAEFHEVTRGAISSALKKLRDIDERRVKAQIVRRIEDRWIGFVLSHKLWDRFNNKNLSAGRAQSPVLRWVIERAKEHAKRKKIAFIENLNLYVEDVDKEDLTVEVRVLERKVESRVPLPPYTTDSMLKDGNSILKMSASEIMKIAQDLFESGLITYHRTDSTSVSDTGLRIAREYLGEEFYGRRWEMEGAHECIRPTRAIDRYDLQRLIQENVVVAEGITWRHLSLYDLIFRRFMASQCRNFNVEIVRYKINVNGKELEEERIVKADGKAYELYKSVWVKDEIPEGVHRVKARILKIPGAPLYTQSDLISLMKEKGIGRPSTYATILEKLFLRNYVIEKNGKLIPTSIGKRVYSFLSKTYEKFVSEERTKILEEKMDQIERGDAEYLDVLNELYEEIMEIE